MSAAEVIERIKALPPEELEILREFLVNGDSPLKQQRLIRYISKEDFDKAAAHVFEVHADLLRKLAD